MLSRVASRRQCFALTHSSRFFPVSTTTHATTWCIVHGHHPFSSVAAAGVTVSSPTPRPASSSITTSGVSSWFRYVSLKEMEKSEIDHLEEFIDLTKHLTNHMTDQSDNHPLIEIAQSIRNRDYLREMGTDSPIPNIDDLCKVTNDRPSYLDKMLSHYLLVLVVCLLYRHWTITWHSFEHKKSLTSHK